MRLTLGRLLRLIGLFLLTRGVRRLDARAPKPTMPGFVLAAYAIRCHNLGISAVLFFFLGILFVAMLTATY